MAMMMRLRRALLGSARMLALLSCSLPGTGVAAACEPVLAVEDGGRILLWQAPGPARERVRGGCAALDATGTRLAYCTRPDADAHRATELFVQPLAGGPAARVHAGAAGEFISEAAWSPDGTRLAYILTDARFRSHLMVAEVGRPAERVASAANPENHQWWSLGWLADGSAIGVHDMTDYALFAADGSGLRESVPLAQMLGAGVDTITSSDKVLPAPHDPTVFAYTRGVSGTARFERAMHEPNSALFLHDRFLGRGKNLRLSGEDVTVIDVAWAPDGRGLYFSGYLDRHVEEAAPFRVYRIARDGQGMEALLRGERVSAGCRPLRTDAALPDTLPSELAALAAQDALSVRALRAWNRLPPRFMQLALELQQAGLDVLPLGGAELAMLAREAEATHARWHPWAGELRALAEHLAALTAAARGQGAAARATAPPGAPTVGVQPASPQPPAVAVQPASPHTQPSAAQPAALAAPVVAQPATPRPHQIEGVRITDWVRATLPPATTRQTVSAGEAFSASFPASALVAGGEVSIGRVEALPAGLMGHFDMLCMHEVTLAGRTTFDEDVELACKLDPARLDPLRPLDAQVMAVRWDAERQVWVELPSEHDAARGVMRARTRHLSLLGWIYNIKVVIAEPVKLLSDNVIRTAHFRLYFDVDTLRANKAIANWRGESGFEPAYQALWDYRNPGWIPFIRDLAYYLERSHARYAALGLTPVRNPLPVEIYPGVAGKGAAGGYEYQSRRILLPSEKFKADRRALKHIAAHELFHAVQHSAFPDDPDTGVRGTSLWWLEASADYAAAGIAWDHLDDNMIGRSDVYPFLLEQPLTDTGMPVDPPPNHSFPEIEYARGYLLEYLVAEGAPYPPLHHAVLLGLTADGDALRALELHLQQKGPGAFPAQFRGFARWFLLDQKGPLGRHVGDDPLVGVRHAAQLEVSMTDGAPAVKTPLALDAPYTAKHLAYTPTPAGTVTRQLAIAAQQLDGTAFVDLYVMNAGNRDTPPRAVGSVIRRDEALRVNLGQAQRLHAIALNPEAARKSALELVVSQGLAIEVDGPIDDTPRAGTPNNGDGRPQPGEQVWIPLRLKNHAPWPHPAYRLTARGSDPLLQPGEVDADAGEALAPAAIAKHRLAAGVGDVKPDSAPGFAIEVREAGRDDALRFELVLPPPKRALAALRLPSALFAFAEETASLNAGLPPRLMPAQPVFIWQFSDTTEVWRTREGRLTRHFPRDASGMVRVLLYDGASGELIAGGGGLVVVFGLSGDLTQRGGERQAVMQMAAMIEGQMAAALAAVPGATLDEKYQAMMAANTMPQPSEAERLAALQQLAGMQGGAVDAERIRAGMARLLSDPPSRLSAFANTEGAAK